MSRSVRILAAGVSLAVLFASTAQAADLIVDTPVAAGVVDVSGSWDGVYLGVFGGYAAGNWAISGDTVFEDDLSGWLVGATLGADFTIADGIVAGVVGDIAWADIGNDPALFAGDQFNVNWVGSLRGKLGFDGGAFLPYLTGGLAVAGGELVETGVDQDTAFYLGWTVGAGVEVAVAEKVSLDLQYRYSNYGSADYEVSGGDYAVEFDTHQITAGLNWRF